jgi:hypothetical protein
MEPPVGERHEVERGGEMRWGERETLRHRCLGEGEMRQEERPERCSFFLQKKDAREKTKIKKDPNRWVPIVIKE